MNSPLHAAPRATLLQLAALALATSLAAQEPAAVPVPSSARVLGIDIKVESSVSFPADNGARMIIQRVAPPVLTPSPVAVSTLAPDPLRLAAWRARMAATYPLETKLLSLTAIVYPGGITFVQWHNCSDDGRWQTYEIWSRADFRALDMADDLVVNRTRYITSIHVFDAKWRFVGQRDVPSPLRFGPGSPPFIITKGDANDVKALQPLKALHQIYADEGPQLTARANERAAAHAAEVERLRTAPPAPPQDTIIQMWPKKRRRPAP
jgi:hypothetical protein